MTEFFYGMLLALWLGVLTSVSPCPLATNIVAISFIGRQVGNPRRVFVAGVLYTLGRALVYAVLGCLLVSSLLSAPYVSHFLQKYMNKLLGPVLIVAGMLLVELIRLPGTGANISDRMQKHVESYGMWGAAFLGVLFALSFCPISAALFFVSLITLAVKCSSRVILPALYGIGTGLPVLFFAFFIALGARSVGQAFNIVSRVEWWARRITGVIFILAGIYFSLVHIFGVSW